MATKSLFGSRKRAAPAAVNAAGGPAHAYGARHELAQLALTGTFGDIYYVDAKAQLGQLGLAAARVDDTFLAQTAIHARAHGHMKDTPAFLLAVLSRRDPTLFARAFPRVVDNGRMVRTFVQVVRSGQAGRTSLGSAPKRAVAAWLTSASDAAVVRASVGNDPSLADVIRMVHPKPKDEARAALLAWVIGRPADTDALPPAVRDFIAYKATGQGPVPDVPFQMLTSLGLGQRQWTRVAERCGWQALRMNLNTFARHGVFERASVTRALAARLSDPAEIARARVLPYQLMVAQSHLDAGVPDAMRDALEAAMEIALSNVPVLGGRVVICPDVSGSMGSPVTGYRPGASTTVRCVDVAALVAAALHRANPGARVLPFDGRVYEAKLDPRDRIATSARVLAGFGGGATDCSAPLARLNARRQHADLVVFVSDNQSWYGRRDGWQTGMERQWEALKRRNPEARMACIDIQPYGTAQVRARPDVMNVGGFSDQVFGMLGDFANGSAGADALVARIEKERV